MQAVSKIHATKAQINSVIMGIQQQLSTMRMAGTLQQSTEIMKSMQQLIKVINKAFILYKLLCSSKIKGIWGFI